MATLVHLDVNDSGAWRRVLTFDAAAPGVMDWVTFLAERLLRNGVPKPPRARLHDAASDSALAYWAEAEGWRPARGQVIAAPALNRPPTAERPITTREDALALARALVREHGMTTAEISAPKAETAHG